MDRSDEGPLRLVNPLGTAFRKVLGSGRRGVEWRVVWLLQLVTIGLALDVGRAAAAALVLLDVALVTAALRTRDTLRAWRERAWRFSERSRWL